ncbi:hypothetical protein FOZ60_003151 [Perkinsus olseni]|uniref:Uncharacterized protein n=1 Tax=Perkinsus olseni TaxID=32597 RepID=A0A7J6NX78_PEROL|nr:hypothetical protein FOZ60_003151 [Perkinsus olseni]
MVKRPGPDSVGGAFYFREVHDAVQERSKWVCTLCPPESAQFYYTRNVTRLDKHVRENHLHLIRAETPFDPKVKARRLSSASSVASSCLTPPSMGSVSRFRGQLPLSLRPSRRSSIGSTFVPVPTSVCVERFHRQIIRACMANGWDLRGLLHHSVDDALNILRPEYTRNAVPLDEAQVNKIGEEIYETELHGIINEICSSSHTVGILMNNWTVKGISSTEHVVVAVCLTSFSNGQLRTFPWKGAVLPADPAESRSESIEPSPDGESSEPLDVAVSRFVVRICVDDLLPNNLLPVSIVSPGSSLMKRARRLACEALGKVLEDRGVADDRSHHGSASNSKGIGRVGGIIEVDCYAEANEQLVNDLIKEQFDCVRVLWKSITVLLGPESSQASLQEYKQLGGDRIGDIQAASSPRSASFLVAVVSNWSVLTRLVVNLRLDHWPKLNHETRRAVKELSAHLSNDEFLETAQQACSILAPLQALQKKLEAGDMSLLVAVSQVQSVYDALANGTVLNDGARQKVRQRRSELIAEKAWLTAYDTTNYRAEENWRVDATRRAMDGVTKLGLEGSVSTMFDYFNQEGDHKCAESLIRSCPPGKYWRRHRKACDVAALIHEFATSSCAISKTNLLRPQAERPDTSSLGRSMKSKLVRWMDDESSTKACTGSGISMDDGVEVIPSDPRASCKALSPPASHVSIPDDDASEDGNTTANAVEKAAEAMLMDDFETLSPDVLSSESNPRGRSSPYAASKPRVKHGAASARIPTELIGISIPSASVHSWMLRKASLTTREDSRMEAPTKMGTNLPGGFTRPNSITTTGTNPTLWVKSAQYRLRLEAASSRTGEEKKAKKSL